jgi:hypothetical protein
VKIFWEDESQDVFDDCIGPILEAAKEKKHYAKTVWGEAVADGTASILGKVQYYPLCSLSLNNIVYSSRSRPFFPLMKPDGLFSLGERGLLSFTAIKSLAAGRCFSYLIQLFSMTAPHHS